MISYIEFKQAAHRYEDLLNDADEYRRYSEVLRNANPLRKLVNQIKAVLRKPAPEQQPMVRRPAEAL